MCKRGDEERGFTADEFKATQANGWEKQYQYFVGKKKVYMTHSEAMAQGLERASKYPKSTKYGRQNPICAEWNSEEQILKWRKAWENVTNIALEKHNLTERIDCRSFAERGIDEQPTIHEGVTARIIEQRGGVSDRCETNRQIRKDNALLREIKEEMKKLTELIKGGVKFVASSLERLRNKIIFGAYELKHNEDLTTELTDDNREITVTLQQYRKIVNQVDNKSAQLAELKSEKENLSAIHFLRHKELTEQISKSTTEIKKLKGIKVAFLERMGSKSEKDIPKYEALHKRNTERLKNISAKNTELSQQKQADTAKLLEIRNGISDDDFETVQEERYNLRDEYTRDLSQKLRDKYGDDYNYAVLRDVERDVNRELHEKPLSMKRKLQRNKQRSTTLEHDPKNKKREQEL